MNTKTKIICTIGPASESKEMIAVLIDSGMNVARLNFSHGDHEEHLKRIQTIQKVRKEKNSPLAIMLDTKGPEIRISQIYHPEQQLSVKKGDKVAITKEGPHPSLPSLSITPSTVVDEIELSKQMLFDDGSIGGTVTQKGNGFVIIEVINPGVLKVRKGVNIPGSHFSIPLFTEKDKQDLLFGIKNGADLIAASFICTPHQIIEMRKFLRNAGGEHIKIIAKIESTLGLDHFDAILHVADGIMVARGDLGVEVPITRVPRLQKHMIKKTLEVSKPVIIATQMLQSMVSNPRPTRAEVSDVANAIYDGCSSVMLSAESAIGSYPAETVRTMKEIIRETEDDFNYKEFFLMRSKEDSFDIASSVAASAVKTALSSKAKAIIVCTCSGTTARILSCFKPPMPIIAITPFDDVYHQLSSLYGVIPLKGKLTSLQEVIDLASLFAINHNLLEFGDVVVVTSGTPFGVAGTTNMIQVQNIGNALVRGLPSKGAPLIGEVLFFLSREGVDPSSLANKIVIVNQLEESSLSILKKAKALIIQNHHQDYGTIELAKRLIQEGSIPVLLQADGAIEALKEEETITFDPQKGLIYRGDIYKDPAFNHFCPLT
jgi:pyruvate kinase